MDKVANTVAIVGGGPAGLMAAEYLSGIGRKVTIFDTMPTLGRKFLLAGKSGLNLTHSEDYGRFATRFGNASTFLGEALDALKPQDIRQWAEGLGTETFVGSSGRVFPKVMKASPLLRSWLRRLTGRGVEIRSRHRWTGWNASGDLVFDTPEGSRHVSPVATLLALGGASWPRLGSDAGWVSLLQEKGVNVAPFHAANCGFEVNWTGYFRDRFAGTPVKTVRLQTRSGSNMGEFVVTGYGIEGSLVYSCSAELRDELLEKGEATLSIDLLPGRSIEQIAHNISKQDKKLSLSNRLRKAIGLEGVKFAMVRELAGDVSALSANELAGRIKALPLRVERPRPIAEAISSAGGVSLDELDRNYMLKKLPGLFLAGEMLDWEAPTGGYLLTACMATGLAAAKGVEKRLGSGI